MAANNLKFASYFDYAMNQLEPVFIPGIFFWGGVPLSQVTILPKRLANCILLIFFSGRDMNYQYITETL